jgi:two-component sensor histidine kinase
MPCCQRCEVAVSTLAVREARARVRAVAELPVDAARDAELVISELVANAVLHARLAPSDHIAIAVCRERRRLTIVVDDHGHFRRGRSNRGGLGFRVLDALCEQWSAHDGRVRAILALPCRAPPRRAIGVRSSPRPDLLPRGRVPR